MIEVTEVNKLPDIAMSGKGLIFLPDSLREYRTVRFITGHLATLSTVSLALLALMLLTFSLVITV